MRDEADTTMTEPYDPRKYRLRTFFDAAAAFRRREADPREYLEECIATIEVREPAVRAFTVTNLEVARAAADAASARYRARSPLSPIDGIPIGIKDLFETRDMPVEMGSRLWKGFRPFRDAAHVHALREAGAVIVGKTVTTEFGMSHPGPTTNPFDPGRTPGGSSSGSAAAVGARMLPAATGSQVVGSIIRPAGFCGNFAMKPTFGALNRGGGHSALSQSHLGVHAGSIEDCWAVMHAIHRRAGGDPGQPGLVGDVEPHHPEKPATLIHLRTGGWDAADPAAREAFGSVVDLLAAYGVRIVTRADDERVEAFERVIADARPLTEDICAYELRWPLGAYRHFSPGALSPSITARLERGEAMSAEDYRSCLDRRAAARDALNLLRGAGNALVTLSQPGPAPAGLESTGDPVFNAPASLTGAPAVTLPVMVLDGLPLGLQLIGFPHDDTRLVGLARWVESALADD